MSLSTVVELLCFSTVTDQSPGASPRAADDSSDLLRYYWQLSARLLLNMYDWLRRLQNTLYWNQKTLDFIFYRYNMKKVVFKNIRHLILAKLKYKY